jgi:hypothetical protein
MKPNPALEIWKKSRTQEQIDAILHYTSVRGEIIHYAALSHYETDSITQSHPPKEAVDVASSNPQMIAEIDIAIELFHNFTKSYRLTPVSIEKAVWTHEHKFAGRLDFDGYLYDEKLGCDIPIVMDIKTSKEIHRDYLSFQLSGYNLCLQKKAKKFYCLLLHPGETQVNGSTIGIGTGYWDFQELTPNYEAFLYYLKCFNINIAKIRDRK